MLLNNFPSKSLPPEAVGMKEILWGPLQLGVEVS